MPVKEDSSGRRSVQVEVEVPGTPEEVWKAIATGPGISSWFVPTTTEDDANGVPVKVLSNFGPGMESVATVTGWNPPQSFSAESNDLGPDAPPVATEWFVEARDGGTCVVRVVHSLFADTDDWDKQLEGWESGWPDFFRLLHLYLTHFSGQPCSSFQLMAFTAPPRDAAWRTLVDGIGFETVATGERVESTGDTPRVSGVVERRGQPSYAEEMLVRLQTPAPGIAHLFAMKMGEQVLLSMRMHLYGGTAADVVAREEPAWKAWLGAQFPGDPAAVDSGATV
ncbi:MAG: SRPBCC domain-containing protein [Phycisphaerales bacterium]|nr:SRPBCC domain-containing protein [Phycisphaerae bacterium]NNF41441.1 SRPBCC domain-containing protein [Phycisphaerales bacterium]NNM26612.1 SRPBCC domain-containing protein [Phycisphaerales bacterium]